MEKAMTQQEVANIMFVTRQCISKWEQGNATPDHSLEKLAQIYRVSIHELIDDESMKTIAMDYASKRNKRDVIMTFGVVFDIVAVLVSIGVGLALNARIASHQNSPMEFTYRGIVVEVSDVAMKVLTDNGLKEHYTGNAYTTQLMDERGSQIYITKKQML